ncbi:hypothetical protein DASC09_049050 [Saccharomycopsis crataegensis]|uniref:Uncharacterized protein n=1 Tax=Saccharomycopsis crataegensis TaxID=43959 RepID=A0AAV5QTM2_9ASCO|nr:hypothetical protein DASC09_049050 [Saccharomycopsis crataegensis]
MTIDCDKDEQGGDKYNGALIGGVGGKKPSFRRESCWLTRRAAGTQGYPAEGFAARPYPGRLIAARPFPVSGVGTVLTHDNTMTHTPAGVSG